jgi:serine/threonine protein kinase
MRLAPGTTLGPYVVISLLGAGGMGEVYRARDLRLERDVAIKVLPRGVLANDAARRRFRKEALALAKLSHPNIAAVYDVGEQDGADYLVMEYVPGRSLAHELARGPVSTKDAILWAEEIASALIEAHENGVIHRDLKPGNVMVTPKGRAKVLDFGLAKLFEPTGDRDITLSLADTNGPVGTPLYMSPEQAEGKIVDSRTDLWSLRVVLYESLSGQHPFRGDSALAATRLSSRMLEQRRG